MRRTTEAVQAFQPLQQPLSSSMSGATRRSNNSSASRPQLQTAWRASAWMGKGRHVIAGGFKVQDRM
jgi:hypothetical protein